MGPIQFPFCGNCNSEFGEDNGLPRFEKLKFSSEKTDEVIEVEIARAVAFIYGIPWDLLTDFLTDHTISGHETNTKVVVALCEKCTKLLDESYKAHKKFEKETCTDSLIQQAKRLRNFEKSPEIKTEPAQAAGHEEEDDEEEDPFRNFNDNSDDNYDSPCSAENFDSETKYDPFTSTEISKNFNSKKLFVKIEKLTKQDLQKRKISATRNGLRKHSLKKLKVKREFDISEKPLSRTCTIENDEKQITDYDEDDPSSEESDQGGSDYNPPHSYTEKDNNHEDGQRKKRVRKYRKGRNRYPALGSKCNRCGGLPFPDRVSYTQHLKTVHAVKSVKGPVTCEICGVTLKSYQHYKQRHLPLHREDARNKCEICGKEVSKKHMKTHMLQQHTSDKEELKEACEVCGKIVLSYNMKVHLRVHNPDSYQCDQCGKIFTGGRCTHSRYLEHVRTHTQGLFKCSVCGKELHRKRSLVEHEKLHSIKNERLFICNVCGKAFKTKFVLVDHLRWTHSEQKQFVCEQCGKEFRNPRNLRVHKKSHENGGKPVDCPKCGKNCKNAQSLYEHDIRMHRERPAFECRICGKVLQNRGNLNVHEKTHVKNTEEVKLLNNVDSLSIGDSQGVDHLMNLQSLPQPPPLQSYRAPETEMAIPLDLILHTPID